MRLGLVSDTHGELENLREAANRLRDEWRVDAVAHLGDDCEDAEVLREYSSWKVLQVPGVFCEHYRDPTVTNRVVEGFAGWHVLLSHTRKPHQNDLPGDPDPEAMGARREVDVVAYGHSHIPEIDIAANGVPWINPGHLKSQDKKGHAPSFAVLEFGPEVVVARLVDLQSGVVIETRQVARKD